MDSSTSFVNYVAETCYSVMVWMDPDWWVLLGVLLFLAGLISLAPWKLAPEHRTLQLVAHVTRRGIVYGVVALLLLLPALYFCYDISLSNRITDHDEIFKRWFSKSIRSHIWILVAGYLGGLCLRFYYYRFIHPWISSTLRDFRNRQVSESESDIRLEREKYNPKDFNPSKFYKAGFKQIFIGLDSDNDPVYVPASTWLETNMMVTGPTRYGKGVVMGCLMDQAIRRGDQLIYIDPKNDRFAPKIMQQTCMELGRPFYYVSLSDNTFGYWSPFEGGARRDAYSRLISIFGMTENSGDADFYKAMEKKVFNRLIKMDDPFDIDHIYRKVKYHNEHCPNPEDRLLKIEAQLENWRQIRSLNPPKGIQGFSLEKAMLEGAVVYLQGSLNDEVIKTATKAFILEVIQEAARLDSRRKHHLTFVIDEVRFLVSKVLADALATIVGFRVNIVTACQSINDLKTPDDINLDGEATYRSISTNSQLKLVYGGADVDTAEWVAKLSGMIIKEVTSMERVEVQTAGAESWERGRTVKPMQEALIHENVALTLPPRVCAVFRPMELATITFTAPVKVVDMGRLDKWIADQVEAERKSIQSLDNEREEKRKELQARADQIPDLRVQPKTAQTPVFTKAADDAPAVISAPASTPVPVVIPPASTQLDSDTQIESTDSEPGEEKSSYPDDDDLFVEPAAVQSPAAPTQQVTTQSLTPVASHESELTAPVDRDIATEFGYSQGSKSPPAALMDIFSLAQKVNEDVDSLCFEELRYLFAQGKRQERIQQLITPEAYEFLKKSFFSQRAGRKKAQKAADASNQPIAAE